MPWQPFQGSLRIVSDAVDGFVWVHGPATDGVCVALHRPCYHRGQLEPCDEPCVWRSALSWPHPSLARGVPSLPEWRADTAPHWPCPLWQRFSHTHLEDWPHCSLSVWESRVCLSPEEDGPGRTIWPTQLPPTTQVHI